MDIMGALAIVTQTLSITKTIREIDKSFDAAEYKAKIAEILEGLTDAKMALLEAKETIDQKDLQLKRLAEGLKRQFELVERKGFRYQKDAAGGPTGRAFCEVCIQKDGTFMQLAEVSTKEGFVWKCPKCDSNFGRAPSSYS